MSVQIISVVVLILSQLLPYIGITVSSEALEGTIQTLVTLVTGITIWVQRTKLRKVTPGEESDVTSLGMRK